MKYEFATTKELPAIERMIRLYLAEQEDSGSPVQLTKRTVDAYRLLASSYLVGSLFGVVVLAYVETAEAAPELVGFALAGEEISPLAFDTTLGRVAFVWQVWVAPEHRKAGAGLGMLTFGRPRLLELGFQTASMSVRAENQESRALCEAFGAKLVELNLHYPLKEEPHGRRQQGQ